MFVYPSYMHVTIYNVHKKLYSTAFISLLNIFKHNIKSVNKVHNF